MAQAEAKRCLSCGLCSECFQCVSACQAHAINHLLPKEESIYRDVGAVILAPGLETYNPETKPEYGYKHYPNVVTSLEFERILSPTGPYGGKVRRGSDKQAPKKIAFIQCVGSREVGRNYCSSVCCMYTAKQAFISKEHEPGLDCTVFYIDIRAVSKGFESYIERAKEEGVHYIRCRPSGIQEIAGTHDLRVGYADENGVQHSDVFNMVVLAVGLGSSDATRRLAATSGIQTNQYGFCETLSFTPTHTSREGVFVCGPYADPMDIPETVAAASAAASHAMSLLADSRGTLVKAKEYPPERDVSAADPRVGVFVCHCGTNIAGVVDVEQVVQYARTLPNVAYAERNLYTCSDDTQKRIREKIAELDLNRVVVASCTPRTHETLFQETIREAGLNPYYFELANIRDQCSWVHMHEPEKATDKAKDLVRIAIAKVRLDTSLFKRPLQVTQAALVLGGGPAGLVAALEIADQGFKVYLVSKNKELGGHLLARPDVLRGEDPRQRLWELMARARTHHNIELFLGSEVKAVSGSLGNFQSTIARNGQQREVAHGVIIVATGAESYLPSECLYGQDPRVVRNSEFAELMANRRIRLLSDLPAHQEDTVSKEQLEQLMATGKYGVHTVAFIQCVGSRCAERPYCSRACCTEAIKNALHIKELNPAAEVYVFYRDIRTYGMRESFYRQAREKGVKFIRYEDDRHLPEVSRSHGRLEVSTIDQMTRQRVAVPADLVVLAAAIVPRPDNKQLAQMLKVPLNENGFFLEAHRKLRPIDFATDGIFLCGTAHSPMGLREAVTQAAGTAARAATILSRQVIDLEPTISHVVEAKCDGCAYCVDPCPFHAITLIEYPVNGGVKKRVQVNEAVCKGCGTCQATCPKEAIFVWHFRPEQLSAEVEAALQPR
jgi:heterodisulfide reductase subunit A